MEEVRAQLGLGAPSDAATRRGTTALAVALEAGSVEVASLLGTVDVWQSDSIVSAVEFEWCVQERYDWSIPAAVRAALVASRQLRDLPRPLVDPRAKERRAMLYRGSFLRLLPYDVHVHVLSFVVLLPMCPGWGLAEFERELGGVGVERGGRGGRVGAGARRKHGRCVWGRAIGVWCRWLLTRGSERRAASGTELWGFQLEQGVLCIRSEALSAGRRWWWCALGWARSRSGESRFPGGCGAGPSQCGCPDVPSQGPIAHPSSSLPTHIGAANPNPSTSIRRNSASGRGRGLESLGIVALRSIASGRNSSLPQPARIGVATTNSSK